MSLDQQNSQAQQMRFVERNIQALLPRRSKVERQITHVLQFGHNRNSISPCSLTSRKRKINRGKLDRIPVSS